MKLDAWLSLNSIIDIYHHLAPSTVQLIGVGLGGSKRGTRGKLIREKKGRGVRNVNTYFNAYHINHILVQDCTHDRTGKAVLRPLVMS